MMKEEILKTEVDDLIRDYQSQMRKLQIQLQITRAAISYLKKIINNKEEDDEST